MSLPAPDVPRIPYVHGRDLVPIRRQPQRGRNAEREALYEAEDDLRATIDEVDRQLVELTERRRHLLDQLGRLHDRIRPIWKICSGRRRRAVSHEEPLPPTAEHPTWLWGRELRAVCLALLRRAEGALSLRQLHTLLHRAGYAISHRTPVKALADVARPRGRRRARRASRSRPLRDARQQRQRRRGQHPARLVAALPLTPPWRGSRRRRGRSRRRGREPVREQGHAGPGHRLGVASRPSPAAPGCAQASSKAEKPGIDLAAIVFTGPAATRFTRMPSGPELAGQVAGRRLEGRLGHPHPVVGGPGHGGVEVEADDRAARRSSSGGDHSASVFSE